MRIAIATRSLQVVGGVETYLRWLIPALSERGHQVALLHEAAATEGAVLNDGVPSNRVFRYEAPGDDGLRRLRRFDPEVVFVHNIQSTALEQALLDAWRCVLFAHDYRGTCATGSKVHVSPSCTPCQRTLGVACLAINYVSGCGIRNPRTLARHYRAQRTHQRLLDRYARIAVASRHMRGELIRHGVEDARLRVLPYPTLEFTPGDQAPSARSMSGRLLFMGRLTRLKGVHLLLEALPLAERMLERRLDLDVAGTGPEEGALIAQAARLGDRVRFHGWVDSGKRALLQSADLLVVPSTWPEPFGIVGPEAFCWGVPAVAFPRGGIQDWLLSGRSGEFARDEASADALAEAIHRALRSETHHQALRLGAWRVAHNYGRTEHLEALELTLSSS